MTSAVTAPAVMRAISFDVVGLSIFVVEDIKHEGGRQPGRPYFSLLSRLPSALFCRSMLARMNS